MAMGRSAARQVVRSRVPRQAMPLPRARLAVPLIFAPHAICPSAASPSTPTPERNVRVQALSDPKPEPPAPPRAPSDLPMILGAAAVVVSIIGGTLTIVITDLSAFKSELKSEQTANSREVAASIRELNASNIVLKTELGTKLDTISKDVAASITVLKSEQAASNSVLTTKLDATNTKLDANTASIRELKSEVNTKLDSFTATVQAQQVETANLQGQVSGLREGGKKK